MRLISVVGQPLAQIWAQAISNSEQNLFCTLAIYGQNAKNIGHDLSLQIEDAKPTSTAELHNLLLDLLSQARNFQVELQLSLCWLNPSNKKLVIAAYRGKILLNRQLTKEEAHSRRKIGTLLESETALRILEGSIQAGDQLILLTQAANCLESEIRRGLNINIEIRELKSLLENMISAMDNSAAMAAILVHPTILSQEMLVQAAKAEQSILSTESEAESSSAEELEKNPDKNKNKNQAQELFGSQADKTDDSQDIKIKISFKFIFASISKLFTFIGGSLENFRGRIKINPAEFIINPIESGKLLVGKIKDLPKRIIKSNSEPKIYLNKNQPHKAIRVILIILIIPLLAAAGWLWRQRTIDAKQNLIREQLSPADILLEEAGQTAQFDIIQARDQTNQAIEMITDIQKEYDSDRLALSYIQSYLEKANQLYEEISGEIELNQLEIFFDLREVLPGFISSQSSISGSQIYLFDQGQNMLISLNVETKQVISFPLGEGTTVKDIAASADSLFLLNQGIDYIALPLTADSEVLRIKEEGDSDREAVYIDFFEGYLYVFNPANRNIFRYVVRDDELSDPAGWLTNKKGIEFDQVSSFAVDGQIWIADRSGTILKFERGEPAEFDIHGLEEELGETIVLYASQDTEFLYVLEPDKSRLLVLNYQGDLIKQINSPTLAGTNHFVVNEEEKKAFVFSGSIIYKVDLD